MVTDCMNGLKKLLPLVYKNAELDPVHRYRLVFIMKLSSESLVAYEYLLPVKTSYLPFHSLSAHTYHQGLTVVADTCGAEASITAI